MLILKEVVQSPLIFCIFPIPKIWGLFIHTAEKTSLNRAEQFSERRSRGFLFVFKKMPPALLPPLPTILKVLLPLPGRILAI